MTKKIKVLFEDNDVIAIDKPAGLVAHSDGKGDEWTVADWVKENHPEIIGVGEPIKLGSGVNIDRPGIVHRLDRETSGVLLIAKNQPSYLFLKRQFLKHEIKKRYHAFLYGAINGDRGTIDRPIGRSTADFRKRSSAREVKGEARKAITRWFSLLKGAGATFVEAQPLTGRTHQIRVHFKAIGHPVICDSLYAERQKPLFGFKRLALHAKAITFRSPGGGEVTVESPYPADFLVAIESFKADGGKPTALLRS